VLQSGKANGPATRKARGMVQAFRLLNGLEDDELDRLIAQADALVLRPGKQLDTQALEAVMKQVRDLTAQATADAQIAAHRGGRWRGLRPAQS
jgi:vancomycin resistance protein YoaR